MKNAFTKTAICSAILAATMSPISSAVASEWSASSNLTLATEQSFRGRSQTNEEAALYGSMDFGHSSGFYAGVWGSNRSYAGGLELDLYAGYAANGFNVGYVRYVYPNDSDFAAGNGGIGADFGELYAKYSIGQFTFGVAYSNDWFAESGPATHFGIDWNTNFGDTNVAVSLGTNSFDFDGFDHENYAFTVTQPLSDNVSVFGSYTGTNLDGRDDSQDGRFIIGVTVK